jgi:hypothetical protein
MCHLVHVTGKYYMCWWIVIYSHAVNMCWLWVVWKFKLGWILNSLNSIFARKIFILISCVAHYHRLLLLLVVRLRFIVGCAIVQTVSRRLPTVMAWVRGQVKTCGICFGHSGTGAGFLWALQFPLPVPIPPTAPHSSSITLGWYNRPISGRHTKWTQSHPTPRNKKKKNYKKGLLFPDSLYNL